MKTEEKGAEKEGGRFSAYKIRWCTSQKKSQVEGVKDLKNNVLLFLLEHWISSWFFVTTDAT